MELTPLMWEIIHKLNERDATTSAKQAALCWKAGRSWHPDDRNAAITGLVRKIKQANKEATGR